MTKQEEADEKIQRAVLELGTEVYRLRSELTDLRNFHQTFVGIVEGLRQILDDKGVILAEDFDGAIDLSKAMTLVASATEYPGLEEDMENLKKNSH